MRSIGAPIPTLATAALLFATACGGLFSESEVSTTTTVGPDGAVITFRDMEIEIPAGALDHEIDLKILLYEKGPEGNLGEAYLFKPEGIGFDAPVTISIQVDEAIVPEGAASDDLALAWEAGGAWVPVTGSLFISSGSTVTGQTTHLSAWAALPTNSVEKTPWLTLKLFGPPPTADGPLPGFAECKYTKICYETRESTALKGCLTSPFEGTVLDAPALPIGGEVRVVVECHAEPGISKNTAPVSKGRTPFLQYDPDEPSQEAWVCMAPPGTFASTCSNPVDPGEPCPASQPAAPRYGATLTSLGDGTVLIAGGTDLGEGCGDWTGLGGGGCLAGVNSSAEIYDPALGTFSMLAEDSSGALASPRTFAAGVTLPDGRSAIFGGMTDAAPLNSVEIYDPVTGTFSVGPPMSETRVYHTATLFSGAQGGLVLLAGGFGSGPATWEIWSPSDGVSVTGYLNEARYHHTATPVLNKVDLNAREVVLIAGGENDDSGGTVLTDLEIFDLNAQAIQSEQPSLCSNQSIESPAPAPKTMHAAAFVPQRHFVYIAGGFSDKGHSNPTRDICVWHTTQEKWQGEAGKFMFSQGRAALTATALPGNVVLFAGGLTGTNGNLTPPPHIDFLFEYLNENGETVVDIGPDNQFAILMHTPRWAHRAILTDDGRVLFVGGLTGSASIPQVVIDSEVFYP